MPAFPDLNQFYMSIYGGYGYDCGSAWAVFLGLAAGVPQTGNPPYTVNDFLLMYPKFFGPATAVPGVLNGTTLVTGIPARGGFAAGQLVVCQGVNFGAVITEVNSAPVEFIGDTTSGSAVISNVVSVAGLYAGMPISGDGIVAGATISAVGTTTVTMSDLAIASAAAVEITATSTSLLLSAAASGAGAVTLAVYESPLAPLFVMQTYLNLALASLMSSRWRESWNLGMGLYIAHFLTLYLQTDGQPQTTASQAVASGLQAGITVSQTADGVSQGLALVPGLSGWAAWTLTSYGVQLATMARVIGAGATYYR